MGEPKHPERQFPKKIMAPQEEPYRDVEHSASLRVVIRVVRVPPSVIVASPERPF